MCFSATVNFAGSAALGAAGVTTLSEVKHRRELLFAAMPLLFAVHQFIEGFVWLGLDGVLSPAVARNMGAAFMLYSNTIGEGNSLILRSGSTMSCHSLIVVCAWNRQ